MVVGLGPLVGTGTTPAATATPVVRTLPVPGATAAPAPAPGTTCEPYGSLPIQDGRYIVQNNVWHAVTEQCIAVTATGFSVVSADHALATGGPPASYPSIFQGCHYGNCSTASPFPAPYSSLAELTSEVAISAPDTGEWDASYDLWFDPTSRTDGQNTGAELMIWIDHRGRPQPAGAKVATVDLAGARWDVWLGTAGPPVVSYVRQEPTTSFAGSLSAFADDSIARGWILPSWYLTSVQFGFEPWVGGAGLGVNRYSTVTPAAPLPMPTTPPATPAPRPDNRPPTTSASVPTTTDPTTTIPTTPVPTTGPPGALRGRHVLDLFLEFLERVHEWFHGHHR
jgi:hypothetical protein